MFKVGNIGRKEVDGDWVSRDYDGVRRAMTMRRVCMGMGGSSNKMELARPLTLHGSAPSAGTVPG